LRQLAEIARQFGSDDKIRVKINEFYKEVLFNFLKGFTDNQERLPNVISIPARREISQPQEREPAKSLETSRLEAAHN
jgi:hypothetical protein